MASKLHNPGSLVIILDGLVFEQWIYITILYIAGILPPSPVEQEVQEECHLKGIGTKTYFREIPLDSQATLPTLTRCKAMTAGLLWPQDTLQAERNRGNAFESFSIYDVLSFFCVEQQLAITCIQQSVLKVVNPAPTITWHLAKKKIPSGTEYE